MKTLATVNTDIPGIKEHLKYDSGRSLHDYDIVVFDPSLPHYSHHEFSDGTSAVDKASGQTALASLQHWRSEITSALKDGKTVFFLLASHKRDSYITDVAASTAHNTSYSTDTLTNYDLLPINVRVTNSEGSKITVADARFTNLFASLDGYMRYEVCLDGGYSAPIATTASGSKALSAVHQLSGHTGHLVLLPYFDLDVAALTDTNANGEEVWTEQALGIGAELTKSLFELDKLLTSGPDDKPQPAWVDGTAKSDFAKAIEQDIRIFDKVIADAQEARDQKYQELVGALTPTALLYETGRPLERAVVLCMKQLGYKVSGLQGGTSGYSLTSPSGKRLIGAAEASDSAAIGIDGFQQIEANITKDFERDNVAEPATGILFGNGYRLKNPKNRGVQFTDKCLINAKRLSVVLLQTSDLFAVAMRLQDNPDDDDYKRQCREAIEGSIGEVVGFTPTYQKKASDKKSSAQK